MTLIVGNSAYEHTRKLDNPITDARNMRDALMKLGFAEADIVYGEDLNKRALEHALGRFAGIARDADVAIAYYAGHGSTFENRSYLVPVDAQFAALDELPYELVELESMLGGLRRAKGVRIALIEVRHELKRAESKTPLWERLGPLRAEIAAYPDGGIVVDMAFFDELNGESSD